MNKLLFLVLIAFAVATTIDTVDTEDFVLEAFDWKAAWNKVKSVVKSAVNFLKENGLWEPLLDTLKKYGEKAAVVACEKLNVTTSVCTSIVDWLVNYLKTH